MSRCAIYKRLSIAGRFSGAHGSNVANPGVNLGKISYLGGRYTIARSSRVRVLRRGALWWRAWVRQYFPGCRRDCTYGEFLCDGTGVAKRTLRFTVDSASAPSKSIMFAPGCPITEPTPRNDLRLAFGVSYQFGANRLLDITITQAQDTVKLDSCRTQCGRRRYICRCNRGMGASRWMYIQDFANTISFKLMLSDRGNYFPVRSVIFLLIAESHEPSEQLQGPC